MHVQLLLLATLLQILSPALADRGPPGNIQPGVCNALPDETGNPPPACKHMTDVFKTGCKDLLESGWCECGTASYPLLTDSPDAPCGYASLDGIGILNFQTCGSSITTPLDPVKTKRGISSPTAIPVGRRQRHLHKRQVGQVRFNANCQAPIPAGSKYGPSTGHNTMVDVLTEAYNDAVELATAATYAAAINKGFTHYFGGNGAATQYRNFNAVMNVIANGPYVYAVEFNCVDSANKCILDPTRPSVMYTDESTGGSNVFKTITACPKFWNTATSRYLLGTSSSGGIGYPPNNPPRTSPNAPYRPRDNTNPGWCTKRKNGNDLNPSAWKADRYATAGTSVLHELTHLDALGMRAGLAPDPLQQHGTYDKQKDCEFTGARQYLLDYIDNKTDGTSPDYNAESYAAAATEIYWMEICGFSEIRPLT
jgi:hypothetical protein